MASQHPMVSRRNALAGLMALGGGAAVELASPSPAGADELADPVELVTIAQLRSLEAPDPGRVYYVTDAGQQGPFRYDPDDSASPDNTGLVVVSGAGARFTRVFEGPLRLSWFGAKADYDPESGAGTPSDDALAAALAALESFAAAAPAGNGHRRGLPTIVFEAGNYLLTRKGFRPQWYRALQGLGFAGAGMFQTNVYFDCPQETEGEDNYLFLNDGSAAANPGVVSTLTMQGLSFFGVSGTERFMYYADTPGGGNANNLQFTQCSWNTFRRVIEFGGRVNISQNRFLFCEIRVPADSVFFDIPDNAQAQEHDFVSCYFNGAGTIFNFGAGGCLHVSGGEIITTGAGCFLDIHDPGGSKVGLGNGRFHLVDVNSEIRDESMLLHLDAPEGHVVFENGRLTTGHGNFAKNWADGHDYAVGDRVRVGPVSNPSKQRVYKCVVAHQAAESTKPPTGPDWPDYWQALFEMQIDSGQVQIHGGQLSYSTLMTYDDDSYQGALRRPTLTVTDGCLLVNPLHDMVEMRALGDVATGASLPRATARGCRPYTGAAPGAYAVTPTDPVDVALNADAGYDGGTLPVSHAVFRSSPNAGEGLPSAADGAQTFLIPQGAKIIGVRLVSAEPASVKEYSVTNHDGSVAFLPRAANASRAETWYHVASTQDRTVVVKSRASRRRDGFILVEYV